MLKQRVCKVLEELTNSVLDFVGQKFIDAIRYFFSVCQTADETQAILIFNSNTFSKT
jgi:hypothetical protein